MSSGNEHETNEQFIARIMNFGCPTGPLIQAFVIQSLRKYAEAVSDAPAESLSSPMLSGESWKATAIWLKTELDRKYGGSGGNKSISDDDLCASCNNCQFSPGAMSCCSKGWPGIEDADGYIQECGQLSLILI